jgi:hypothetical protein|tara:strand:+ start:8555 stop:9016 length:462 start_codon:yes stop_codon:yes gene_type:complete
MIYKFKSSTRPTEESQQVGETLLQIKKDQDVLHACEVVAQAKEKDSVLHKYFQWDDTLAAEQHRLNQARHLITSVEIVRETGDNRSITIPAYTHLRVDKHGYRDTEEVYSVQDLRSSLVTQLKIDWETLKKKHDSVLQEIASFESFNSEVTNL